MANFFRDFRFGLRLLLKNRGFTAVAVFALAIGIAANTAMFSVVYATLLAPLPFPNPQQLVVVWSKIQTHRNVVAAGTFLDWKRDSAVFQDLNAVTGSSINLAITNRPEQVQGRAATPGFLSMMGYRFLLGRDFLPEAGQVGSDHEAILANKFWRSHFGADLHIVGRQVTMNGEPYTIVGVLAPARSDFMQSEIDVPLAFKPDQINQDFHWLLVTGRMKRGVTLAQANADMKLVSQHLAEAYPRSDKGWGASVEPFHNDFLDRDVIRGLWLLMGAVGFVLLIACANVANLLLARATVRQKEVAVRASLGASRRRLFGQFLAESIALASIGCVVGIALSFGLLKLIVAVMPPTTLSPGADIRLNGPVLLFTVGVSLLSGLLFGCAPAWLAARTNLNEELKEGGRSGFAAAGRHGLRRVLVVAESALALSLLAGGGLAIHSLWNVAHVDLGFRSDHLLTFTLPVPDGRLTSAPQMNSFYRQLLSRIGALPGVSSVSASTGMPVEGPGFGMPFVIEGHPVSDPSQRPTAGFNMVTPEYFKTFGIRIDRGREFSEQDIAGGMPVAIVNETFAKKFFPKGDALFHTIHVEQLIPGVTNLGPYISWQIVGVYHDVHNRGPKGDFPEIDVPFWQSPWPQAVMAVRAQGDPASLTKSISAIVASVQPNLPLADVRTMDQILDQSMAGDRFTAFLFGGFAVIALLLASLGIYGVMSFAVAQRTHEIGLRMALGASAGRVIKLVLREGMLLAFIGLVLGLVGAYFVGRGMHSLFFDVGTIDGAAFGAVAVLLVLSALLACYIPAHRASRVDPMQALRHE
jgi:putative ABC transport system permease protein